MGDDDRRIIFTADARFVFAKASDGKPNTLTGYALVWNQLSSDRGGYKVRLLPNSAKFSDPTLAVYHHETPLVIGTTANKTLRLTPDEYGVKAEIDLPDTSAGRDVGELVGKRYVSGMSFAMVNKPRGREMVENGQRILEASDYLVDEISVTPTPAFRQATVGMKTESDGVQSYADRASQSLTLERFKFDSIALPAAEIARAQR